MFRTHRATTWVVTSMLLLATLLAIPFAASAQTITDPTSVQFTPSADQDAVDSNGSPVLTGYALDLYVAGAETPFDSVDLGKPSPGANGLIQVPFVSLLSSLPDGGTTYEARVRAVGPGGSTASDPSNTFTFTLVCNPSISPSSQSVAAAGASGSVTVTAASGCTWTATSGTGWINITSGATGSGGGSVGYSIDSNGGATQRTGTATIAGQVFSVTQAAATTSCSFALDSTSDDPAAGGGTGSVRVTTDDGCAWTASSDASWLTITRGTSGSGSGTVRYSVSANTGSSRTGHMKIAGMVFTVVQDGAACSYAISPSSIQAPASGATGSVKVTTSAGCGWSASTSASWLSLKASGTGTASVSYTVAPNTAVTGRSTTASVAGHSFTVTQAGRVAPPPPTGLHIIQQ